VPPLLTSCSRAPPCAASSLSSLSRYAQLKRQNDDKDLLRGLKTPVTFAALAFIVHIVSVVLDVVELDTIAGYLAFLSWLSIMATVAWVGLNQSGQFPEVVDQLNSAGDVVYGYGQQGIKVRGRQGGLATGRRPPAKALAVARLQMYLNRK